MDLHDIDLNLLVVLDAIYNERNLTCAGKNLRLSQSAMSHALNRLRTLFEDQLFIRQGNQMVPTALADDLVKNIQTGLGLIKCTLDDKGEFCPETSEATFHMGMTDYTAWVLLPKLMPVIRHKAPNIRIHVQHLNTGQREAALEKGIVDLVIGYPQEYGANIYQQWLFDDKEICILPDSGSNAVDHLDLKAYRKLEFIKLAVIEYGEDPVDAALTELGIKRKVKLLVQHELMIPELVIVTGFAAHVAERLALGFADRYPLTILPIPIENAEFPVHQFWHNRNHMDPAHKWFRKTVKQITEKICSR